MERYADIIRRTLELADTSLEALEQTKIYLSSGRFGEGQILLYDAFGGYYQVEKSLSLLEDKLALKADEIPAQALRGAMEAVVAALEQGEEAKVLELMQFYLIPTYKQWRDGLSQCLRPLISS